MSNDRAKSKQAHQNETLAEIQSSTGLQSSAGFDFSAETEISDETLEAVAGGVVSNPPVNPPLIAQD